jgi:hypothetical protein
MRKIGDTPFSTLIGQGGTPFWDFGFWLKLYGQAQLSTTAIYANAVGEEEKNVTSRMWG